MEDTGVEPRVGIDPEPTALATEKRDDGEAGGKLDAGDMDKRGEDASGGKDAPLGELNWNDDDTCEGEGDALSAGRRVADGVVNPSEPYRLPPALGLRLFDPEVVVLGNFGSAPLLPILLPIGESGLAKFVMFMCAVDEGRLLPPVTPPAAATLTEGFLRTMVVVVVTSSVPSGWSIRRSTRS